VFAKYFAPADRVSVIQARALILKRDGPFENGATESETPVEAKPETTAVCCQSFLCLYIMCIRMYYDDALRDHYSSAKVT
jgi:hypothetical protein